jgi:DNA-binding CsgD family transcriptional regulator
VRGAGLGGSIRVVRCPTLVGRIEELAVLQRAYDQAGGGAGAWVNVAGEAGVGKTRLVEQLVEHARESGALVAVGRTSVVDLASPYRPLAQVLLGLARDVPPPVGADIAPYAAAVARFVPHWRIGDAPAPVESPAVLAESLLRILRWRADGAPIVVVLEDLHWADPATLAALAHLADLLEGSSMLVVTTCRPEETDPRSGVELARHPTIRLEAFARADIRELAERCLGSPLDDGRLIGLEEATGGLPLLIEDLLDTTDPTATRFADLVRGRLAELSDDARQAVVAAALIGERFDLATLAAACSDAAAGIDDACALGLVIQEGDGLRFRHALTHQLVMTAAPLLRTQMAAAVAVALEAVATTESLGRAADLWAEAGEPAAAVKILRGIADDAARAGAPSAALVALARAAELVTAGADRLEIDIERLTRLAGCGRVDDAEALGATLLDRAAHDRGALDRVHLALARSALDAGWPDRARTHLHALDRAALHVAEAAVLSARLALQSPAADRRVAAEHQAHQAVAAAERAGRPDLACEALDVAARCARSRSLLDARAELERALAIADANELGGWRLQLLNELGTVEMLAAADGARLQRAYDAAMGGGALDVAVGTMVNLASLHAMRGELDETRNMAIRARDAALRLGLRPLAAAATVMEAISYGFRGEAQPMERLLRAAHELSPEDTDLDAFAWGAGRGLCALLREDRPTAIGALRRARQPDAPVGSLDTARAPLLLVEAVAGTATAADRDAARATAAPGAGWSDLWMGYAEAVLAGGTGDRGEAGAAFGPADTAARRHPLFRAIGLRLVAEAALRDGWGAPISWLRDAEATFVAGGQDRIAAACRSLLKQAGAPATRRRGADRALPAGLLAAGVTAREAEVLDLVAERMGNKEIAARLFLSPRTVEKHVSSLLTKLDAPNRAALGRLATDR